MYRFKIKKQENDGYRFELGDIKMLIDDYVIKEDKHLLQHPNKAIAFFTFENNIYGVSNDPIKFNSAEAFYDAISKQYSIFTTPKPPMNNNFRPAA